MLMLPLAKCFGNQCPLALKPGVTVPDTFGRLSPDEMSRAVAWIKEKTHGGLVCPVCHSNDWSVNQQLYSPAALVGTPGRLGFNLGGSVNPQVLMICRVCAHVVHFNAILMGLALVSPPGTGSGGTSNVR